MAESYPEIRANARFNEDASKDESSLTPSRSRQPVPEQDSCLMLEAGIPFISEHTTNHLSLIDQIHAMLNWSSNMDFWLAVLEPHAMPGHGDLLIFKKSRSCCWKDNKRREGKFYANLNFCSSRKCRTAFNSFIAKENQTISCGTCDWKYPFMIC